MLQRLILLAVLVAAGLVEAVITGQSGGMAMRGSLMARQFKGKGGKNNGQNNGQNNGKNNGQNNGKNNGQNNGKNNGQNNGQNNGNNNGGGNCLNPNVISKASATTGQEPGTNGVKAGQAQSKTDANNFIAFCAGKTITNGKQNKAGSCNPIPMGDIPAQNKMVSAIITNPKPNDKLPAGQTFKIQVQTTNLKAGQFTNPTTTYYTAPQFLDGSGQIVGHCHVTVQDIGSLTTTKPPDAARFAFFKGIDDAGNGQGLLSADVTNGLPPGIYRVCTIVAGANHQPVYMPVAQRGAQDDCTKFEVVGGGGGNNGGQNNGKNNGGQNNGKNNGGQNNGKNNGGQNNGKNNAAQGGKNNAAQGGKNNAAQGGKNNAAQGRKNNAQGKGKGGRKA